MLDERNAAFWDELCGSQMARALGITDASPESLRRFDEAYLGHYPYLQQYLDHPLRDTEVLEIGLGYGTLSGQLMDARRELPRSRHRRRPGADGARPVAPPGGEDAESAHRPGLRARAAVARRAVRLRLHDRLPAPHRQPAARGRRGPQGAAAGRDGRRDALQPALLPAAREGPASRTCATAAGRATRSPRCTTPTPRARPRRTPTTSPPARCARSCSPASAAWTSTAATSTTSGTCAATACSGISTGCWVSTSTSRHAADDDRCRPVLDRPHGPGGALPDAPGVRAQPRVAFRPVPAVPRVQRPVGRA